MWPKRLPTPLDRSPYLFLVRPLRTKPFLLAAISRARLTQIGCTSTLAPSHHLQLLRQHASEELCIIRGAIAGADDPGGSPCPGQIGLPFVDDRSDADFGVGAGFGLERLDEPELTPKQRAQLFRYFKDGVIAASAFMEVGRHGVDLERTTPHLPHRNRL